jgi:AraC-like DNA-binding protein
MWVVTLFISAEAKIAEYIESRARLDQFDPGNLILYLLLDIWLFSYIIASLRMLRHADSDFLHRDSTPARWLRNLLIAFLAMLIFSTVLDLLALDRVNMRFTPLLGTLILCNLSYLGLRQSGMIAPSAGEMARKYAKSTLTVDQAEKILHKLQQAMQQEKLFADSTLSLPKLAKKLGVSTHHLSQLINERFQQNFFNYLSSVRVEEAKKLLSAPASSHLALSEIAYAVGFNSLSAFSATFKKQSGMSPSQFQKQHTSQAGAE